LLVELAILVDDTVERGALLRECQAIAGNLTAAATAKLTLRRFTD
jgi:hypothetical protein